ncbi:MAG: N-acetylglucosamine transferase, partial [Pseudodonghicola sp.]
GSEVARFYSLASGCRDDFVEIAVKKHPGGLCSAQLMALQPGDRIQAFIRRNPDFRPGPGRAPLILIGAGTGVAPLAGFLRGNARHRPAYLIFGLRHPDSDFLYREEFATWQQDGRLTRLLPAVSRGDAPAYVQDVVRREGPELARLIRDGARVLVCGGREMASGVTTALAEVLAPFGTTPADLKAEGRYVEDVY